MTREIRQILLTTAAAFAIVLSACGSAVDESADASPSIDEPTPAQEVTPTAPPAEEPTAEVTDDATPTDPADPAVDALPEGAIEVSGTMAFEWTPSCSMGPPFTTEPADCDTFAGYTIVAAALPVVRTGTLTGTEEFHVTLVVAPDGEYVFAGISLFVGTVAECGEGTVVFNTAGSGRFDIEQSAETGALVSGPVEAITYTAARGVLGNAEVFVDLEMTSLGSTSLDVTGTLLCGDAAGADTNAVRPTSGVSPTDASAWTGPSTFTVRPTCNTNLGAPNPCPSDERFTYLGLFNSLQFSGAFDGNARFVGTNIVSSDAKYENSGILIFEGMVEGCGDGTVLMVNEATGSAFSSTFIHQRAFSVPLFDTGTIDVHVDGSVEMTGLASGEMTGTYSC